MIKKYVQAAADPRLGGRLLAWAGLADTGKDGPEAHERNASLRQEVEQLQERQQNGELDERHDAAALLLIMMSAANALAVYPQLARGLFEADATSPEVVERYAAQLAQLIQPPRDARPRGRRRELIRRKKRSFQPLCEAPLQMSLRRGCHY
ncbi:hypothetical protein [Streptomyces sp. NPDC127108]|uniref:hypothetical protein n=1 Tax=Streptomyces sp. NPDC127108 TaxID=3345361 RepID=UPI00364314F8